MNWKNVKEFLKPDWRKIVVFIIFRPLLSFIQSVFLIPLFLFNTINELTASVVGFVSSPFFILFSSLLPQQPLIGLMFPFNLLILMAETFDAIYVYAVSCLIVCVYDKVKKEIGGK